MHIILHQATEFRPNRSTHCGNMTSYPFFKMAAATAEYYFRLFRGRGNQKRLLPLLLLWDYWKREECQRGKIRKTASNDKNTHEVTTNLWYPCAVLH